MNKTRLLALSLSLAMALTALPCGRSLAQESSVEALLSRQIIGPDVGMAEVQDYIEARVPRMPKVETLAEWEKKADQIRHDMFEKVVYRGQAAQWRDAKTRVVWLETIPGGPGYHIKKLRYEALPGLWIPALLYIPDKLSGKVPVVMNVNGHDGDGKVAEYKQLRCINQVKRGMLALNVEWLGMGQLRTDNFQHYRSNQLNLCGTSGLAPFYLSMKRGLDVLLSHENADPKHVAVAGLSGGGWQTIFISSLDTRVTLTNPVAGYSSFLTRVRHLSDLGDSEQTPCDMASVADYAHLTAMMAPRAALLTFNEKDNCCFAAPHALGPLMNAAGPIFKLYGKEGNLQNHTNYDPGTHNFLLDNRQALYRMFVAHGFDQRKSPSGVEIDSTEELKTKEELHVELPSDNADFHTLALGIAKDLPRHGALPKTAKKAKAWRTERVKQLASLVSAKQYDLKAQEAGKGEPGERTSVLWRLRIGDSWTVPAVEISVGKPTKTAILLTDSGRKTAAARTQNLLDEGYRVVALDPFYFGESKIAQRDFLFALLVSSLGERPLGIQASQVGAVARWLKEERKLGEALIVADGRRSSLIALTAAALENKAVGGVRLHAADGSLKEVIERNDGVNQTPEMFCFGLLEHFDIKQLTALAAPRPVTFIAPSERVKSELASVADFYSTLGKEFDPVKDN